MVQSDKIFTDHLMLGQQALFQGNAAKAFECWSRCLDSIPSDPVYYRQLALSFRAIGHLTQSQLLLQTALMMRPNDWLLLSDLANLRLERGEPEAALEALLQLTNMSIALGEAEMALSFLSNALMSLEYSSEASADTRKCLADKWGELATAWVKGLVIDAKIPAWTPNRQNNRLLRIGFISGDLCDHPVGFLLLPLLKNHSGQIFKPHIYDNGSRQDRTNHLLRACVDDQRWNVIDQVNDADLIRKILNDQLDILIDLSGHTGKSRLRIMAHRLAGSQLSWLGFSATTGLPTIDGVILDSYLEKDGVSEFSESVLKLDPSRFCFNPPFAPPLGEPPCLKNGFITFGCFNNSAKYNPSLFALWARILKQVPCSKLMLKWRTFADPVFCEQILKTFEKNGVERTRIVLKGFSPHRQMLDDYNACDVALDTFPFNGGYTTLEALWMGLPMVTLAGDTPISRQSASFLNVLNRTSWVAKSPDGYVAIAGKLAGKPDFLVQVRNQLRFQIMESALYDANAFAMRFESLINNSSLDRMRHEQQISRSHRS